MSSMNLYNKYWGCFDPFYTHIDSLPDDIKKPNKSPFILLISGYSKSIGKDLLSYGSTERSRFVVTSKRKVIRAIDLLLKLPAYDHPHNDQAKIELEKIKQDLLKTLTPATKLAKKQKRIEHYKDSEQQIVHPKGVPEALHSVKRIVRIKDNVPKEEVLKNHPAGRKIIEIETFSGICYRLLLNDRAPKVRTVVNDEGENIGNISRLLPNAQSIHDYYVSHGNTFPDKVNLIRAGIGRILAAAYCEEENDLHGGNIIYDETIPGQKKTYKIDHDQSLWPITAKYANEELRYVTPVTAFPITQYDLNHFPFLRNAKPRNFLEPTLLTKLKLADLGIELKNLLIKDAFTVLLKKAVITESMYEAIAEASISNERLKKRLVNHQTTRSQLLKEQLLQNATFLLFIRQNPDMKQEILAEFATYNAEHKVDSTLRVDLEVIAQQLDAMIAQMNNKNHKMYLEACGAEQDPIWDKNQAISFIQKKYSYTQDEAILIFDQGQAQVPQIFDEILADIRSLHKKVGIFGGEHRQLDGEALIIPKGAAQIFDVCCAYKNNRYSADGALNLILKQAKVSAKQNSHTFFNSRDPATQAFYDRLMKVPSGIEENKSGATSYSSNSYYSY